MLKLLIIVLIIHGIASHPTLIQPRVDESTEPSYRLSGKVIPETYNVDLIFPQNIFTGQNTSFTGIATITFKVTEESNTIELHSPSQPTANDIEVKVVGQTAISNPSEAPFLNTTSSILTLTFSTSFNPSQTYEIKINYNAQVEPVLMSGAYLSYYTLNDVNKYMVTTQFQPDYARKAFPCFDEPEFKAEFTFSITRPADLSVLFNTVILTDEVVQGDSTLKIARFETTPVMSTYLIAFVISEFTCDGLAEIEPNVPHQVCSRSDAVDDRVYANEWSPKIMNKLEELVNIKYSEAGLKKIDQIAVPDFSAGAMENWGLVTYRENALLFNSEESTASNRQTIITIVAHEFAHMWFGNLVTTKWWNTLFLNEGFASYFEYFGPAAIEELEEGANWELAKQFILDQQQSVFITDGFITSAALSSQASSSSEIWGKFGQVSYLKGASIIRMVHNFFGKENFFRGINHYLTENKYKPVQPWNLWEALQSQIQENVNLPSGTTLEGIMSNWVNESGYPVVTVQSEGNDVTLSQKRFLYVGTSDTQWYIPISYTTSSNLSGFEDVTPTTWLLPGDGVTLKLSGVLPNNGWIILNNQESAYYRVNYDDILWNRITQALESNHSNINVLNRAQIVDDALNLARAGLITFPKAFEIINYLRKETEYYPIYSALNNLDILTRTYGEESQMGLNLVSLQLRLLESAIKEVDLDDVPLGHINIKKSTLILSRLCRLGHQPCLTKSTSLFESFKTGEKLANDFKSIVYCNALRQSKNQSDWYLLWNNFQNNKIATEEVLLLSVLGCTKDEELLNFYLSQTLNETSGIRHQDISRVWSSVISSNSAGVNVAIKFYIENYAKIIDRYSQSVSVLSTAASYATTAEQETMLQEFANRQTLPANVKAIATSAYSTVKSTREWAEARRPQLENYFRGSSAKIVGTVWMLALSIVIMFFTY